MAGARDRGGFTLVELIIALGIVAILAAIAVPVYASQSALAGTAVLKANTRDVKIKLTSFILDGLDTPYRAASQDAYAGASSAEGYISIALANTLGDAGATGSPEALDNPISGSSQVVNAPGTIPDGCGTPPAVFITNGTRFLYSEIAPKRVWLAGTIMVVWNSAMGRIELFWMDENGTKSPTVDYLSTE
jgi:prepilin-type N-terminal cleavage/methylation domain-containing protein